MHSRQLLEIYGLNVPDLLDLIVWNMQNMSKEDLSFLILHAECELNYRDEVNE